MKKSIFAASLAAAGMMTSFSASADDFDYRWYGNAMAGATFADTSDGADFGPVLYLGFGKGLSENVRMEVDAFYSNLDLDGAEEGDEYEKWGVGVTGLYSFNPGAKFEFYGLAGLQGVNVNIGGQSYNSPQTDIGGGMLIPLTRSGLAIRAEYRYRLDFHGSDIDNSYTFYDHILTAGIHMPFGDLVRRPHGKAAPKKGDVYTLPATSFALDSARLTAGAKRTLDRVVATMKLHEGMEVEIGGHADDSGAKAYNLDLSRRRAESVRNYIASRGISKSRMTTRAYGESRPIADNATAAGRMRNRRVELTVQ